MKLLTQLYLLAFAFFASGCLEVKQQVMSYHYDRESDELRIFQDYRGIFGSGDPSPVFKEEGKATPPAREITEAVELSDSDEAELDSLMKGTRVYFFSNWLFVYDRESLADPDEDLPDEVKALFKLLLNQIRVRDASLYLDAEGKLCGVQSVTFSNLSQIVAAVNGCAPTFFAEMEKDGDSIEAADRRLLAKARNDPDWKLLEIEGNTISFHWPLSLATYKEDFDKDADAEEMRAAGIGISWKEDVVTVTIGKKDDEITRISLETSGRDYTPNAIAPARAKHTIKEKFDPEAAAKTFLLGKRSRDAAE